MKKSMILFYSWFYPADTTVHRADLLQAIYCCRENTTDCSPLKYSASVDCLLRTPSLFRRGRKASTSHIHWYWSHTGSRTVWWMSGLSLENQVVKANKLGSLKRLIILKGKGGGCRNGLRGILCELQRFPWACPEKLGPGGMSNS